MDALTVRVKWKEKSEILENLDGCRVNEFPMKQGLEAEVRLVEACGHFFVMKIWNKQAKADVEKQFRLLKALACQGISVSKPHGWGTAENGAPVLLTSYDGECMRELAPGKLVSMADALANLHDIPTSMTNEMQLEVKDFPSYFFPSCPEYPDLQEKLEQLLSMVDIRQFDMIHGDLHWENFVENEGELTIIDWTNIQLGDRRYDVAWTLLLMQIYPLSGDVPGLFLEHYLARMPMTNDELVLFEGIALIRWILLYRTSTIPVIDSAKQTADVIIRRNRYMKDVRLDGRL